jgi:hypothetical protein
LKPPGAVLAAGLLLVEAGVAHGDEPAIVADRPGFGESASVVAPSRLQLESGAAYTWVDGDTTAFDAPQSLVRVGLRHALELRLGVPDWVDTRGPSGTATGWTDLSVGVKGHVAIRGNDLSLRATAYFPTGSPDLTSDLLDPELAVAWSRALSGPWSLGATVSQRWLRQYRQSLTSPSVSVGHSLGRQAATFIEYDAVVSPATAPLHRIDHGYTWDPGLHTQVDFSLGVVLSRAPTAYFVGAGFCHRF